MNKSDVFKQSKRVALHQLEGSLSEVETLKKELEAFKINMEASTNSRDLQNHILFLMSVLERAEFRPTRFLEVLLQLNPSINNRRAE